MAGGPLRAGGVWAVGGLVLVVGGPAAGAEMLVQDWNPKTVTAADHGFPEEEPIAMGSSNGDWTQPVDYATGVIHHRAEVRSMPTSQPMLLQLCFHQAGISREECGAMSPSFDGPAGAEAVVVIWESPVDEMWELPGGAIDWTEPRDSMFVPIRQGADEYISDYPQLNGGNLWAGEDPDDWYPMVLRLTSVVVSSGATFSGWEGYVGSPDGGAGGGAAGASPAGGSGPGGAAPAGGAGAGAAGMGGAVLPASDGDSGCGCRLAAPGPCRASAAALLGLLGLLRWRRSAAAPRSPHPSRW